MARPGVYVGLSASWAVPPASRYTCSSGAFYFDLKREPRAPQYVLAAPLQA
jgi:hypothetical protein